MQTSRIDIWTGSLHILAAITKLALFEAARCVIAFGGGICRFLSRPWAPRSVSPFVLPYLSFTAPFSNSVAATATWPAFLSFFFSSRRLRVALPWAPAPGETLFVLSGVLLAIFEGPQEDTAPANVRAPGWGGCPVCYFIALAGVMLARGPSLASE